MNRLLGNECRRSCCAVPRRLTGHTHLRLLLPTFHAGGAWGWQRPCRRRRQRLAATATSRFLALLAPCAASRAAHSALLLVARLSLLGKLHGARCTALRLHVLRRWLRQLIQADCKSISIFCKRTKHA